MKRDLRLERIEDRVRQEERLWELDPKLAALDRQS